MGTLLVGVIVWTVAHLVPSVLVRLRDVMWHRLGMASRGLMAALILSGLFLIVTGWREAVPVTVYDPPVWGRHLNMVLMYVAMLMFVVSRDHSRLRMWIGHPMLTGAILWAVGHLFANGDSRSVVLFGGIGLWAVVEIITITRRDGPAPAPSVLASPAREAMNPLAAAIVYAALLWGHGYFTGMPLLPA